MPYPILDSTYSHFLFLKFTRALSWFWPSNFYITSHDDSCFQNICPDGCEFLSSSHICLPLGMRPPCDLVTSQVVGRRFFVVGLVAMVVIIRFLCTLLCILSSYDSGGGGRLVKRPVVFSGTSLFFSFVLTVMVIIVLHTCSPLC